MKFFTALALYAAGAISVYAREITHVSWHGWLATVLGVVGIGCLNALSGDDD